MILPNRPEAQRVFHHLRFQTNAFISALSTYIADSAIGANYNTFMERLVKLRHGVSEQSPSSSSAPEDVPLEELRDVFSILAYHSAVMDKILEACLLKTRHRSVGASLVSCMDSVLHLGKLVVGLKAGTMSEETAERKLRKIHDSFHSAMENLVSNAFHLIIYIELFRSDGLMG